MSRILILEDEFDLRETLTMFLSEVGFSVEGTARVRDAIEMIHDRHFDAVLLDLMLPDGNGNDVLEEIRGNESLEHMPVIIMSAIPPVDRTKAQREVPFLQKPFSFKKLQKALDEVGVWKER